MIISTKYKEGCLTTEFNLFGSETVIADVFNSQNKESAGVHFHQLRKDILLINFERYIHAPFKEQEVSEGRHQSWMRCLNANTYFNEHQELTLFKICNMILKIQKELVQILNTKEKDYDKNFDHLNSLIKFCKEEIKHPRYNNADQET